MNLLSTPALRRDATKFIAATVPALTVASAGSYWFFQVEYDGVAILTDIAIALAAALLALPLFLRADFDAERAFPYILFLSGAFSLLMFSRNFGPNFFWAIPVRFISAMIIFYACSGLIKERAKRPISDR